MSILSVVIFLIAFNLNAIFGGWDAYAIWNVKGQLLASLPEMGYSKFKNLLEYPHPDYPLFWPCSVAIVYQVAGIFGAEWWPIFMTVFFTLATSLLYFQKTWPAEKAFAACLSLLVTFNFVKRGSAQYSDIPLSFFVVLSIVFLSNAVRAESRWQNWAMAGLVIGVATWVKNEGIFYCAIFFVCAIFYLLKDKKIIHKWRNFAWLGLGSLPFLLTTFYFKTIVNHGNDVVGQNLSPILERLFDWDCYAIIFNSFVQELLSFSGSAFQPIFIFILFVILIGFQKTKWEFPNLSKHFLIPFLMVSFTGFFMIYIITPHDLKWHLNTSLSRILMQIYPVFLLLFFENLPNRYLRWEKSSLRKG